MSAAFLECSPEPQPIEELTRWPALCHVCHHERGVTKWSATREKALKHRRKAHPWLAAALQADGGSR